MIRIGPHATERMVERGASREEVEKTIQDGKTKPAKHGRTGFRHTFDVSGYWNGKPFHRKEVVVYAVEEDGDWTVVTVICRYFSH